MKKVVSIILVLSSIGWMLVPSLANDLLTPIYGTVLNDQLNFQLDGEAVIPVGDDGTPVLPITYNSTTYLPVRAVGYMLGLGIDYDAVSKTVLITSISNKPAPTALGYEKTGQLLPISGAVLNKELRFTIDNVAVIPVGDDGNIVYPISYNGTTYLPVRALGYLLELGIDYNSLTKTVIITRNQGAWAQVTLPKKSVDLSLSNLSLIATQGSLRPGKEARFSVSVNNVSKIHSGGFIEFFIGDQVVTNTEFYFSDSSDKKTVTASYSMPYSYGRGLSEEEFSSLSIKARFIPDALTQDTNSTNNMIASTTSIYGVEESSLVLNSAAVRLNRLIVTHAVDGTNPAGAEAALPGESLSIRAYMNGEGKTRVSIYVNDELVKQSSVTVSRSYEKLVSMYYKVPEKDVDQLNIRVELDNGERIESVVPVEKYDFYVLPSDITCEKWGSGYYITARIHRGSNTSFGDTSHTLRTVFLIDGVASEPYEVVLPSGTIPFIATVRSNLIPISNAESMQVMVVTDAAKMFEEEDEANNIASVEIPKVLESNSEADVSVDLVDVGYSPSIVVPGDKIELFANFKNRSSEALSSSIKVRFSINGEVFEDTISPSELEGGQYNHFYKMWTVPMGLVEDPILTVELDPEHVLNEGNISNNIVTKEIPLARPDLSVVASGSGALESFPSVGNQVQLSAKVTNSGQIAASSVGVEFILDGNVVGTETLDVAPFSTVVRTISVELPELSALPVDGVLSGFSGHVARDLHTRSVTFSARVDQGATVAESNELNNESEEITLYALRPSSAGTVYVKATDLFGEVINGAAVTISVSGQNVTAQTDAYGYCTFKYVPFGVYEVSGLKTGYRQEEMVSATLLAGDQYQYSTILLDDSALFSGKVTSANGTPLEGVTIFVKGSSYRTSTSGSGEYHLALPASSYQISYMEEGYGKIIKNMTLAAGAVITENLSMTVSNNTYISGTIYDSLGMAYDGMTVQIKTVNGVLLGSAVTDLEGNYYLEIPLSSTSMWIAVDVSGNGDSATQGVYATKGLESRCDISFVPVLEQGYVNSDGSIEVRVVPWVECASMPGTIFNPDYKVETIYGSFDMTANMEIANSRISGIDITTAPLFWIYACVSSSWNPLDLIARNDFDKTINYCIGAILPIDIPIAMNMHSTNSTMVWVKKIAVVSDGQEVAAIYPDAVGSYSWDEDIDINMENSKVKFYLKIDPDDGVVNPARGYGKDRILIEWDPKTKSITKMSNYIVIGWDEVYAHEKYMDE